MADDLDVWRAVNGPAKPGAPDAAALAAFAQLRQRLDELRVLTAALGVAQLEHFAPHERRLVLLIEGAIHQYDVVEARR